MAAAIRSSDRGDAAILGARAALIRGARDAVGSILSRGADVDAEVRVHGVAALTGVETFLNGWLSSSPDDPDLHLLLGVRRLDSIPWLGLELQPQRTDEQRRYDEIQSLWHAVEHLQRTLADDPERAVAKVWMAAVVGALVWRGSMPREDFEVCAAAAEAALPGSVQVARWRIHLASPQANPSGVVDPTELAAAWGAGDPRQAEVATAHIDRFIVLSGENKEAGDAYWLQDDVHSALVAANERFNMGGPGPASVDASNLFAFALGRTRQPRLAIPHLDRIDGRLLTWPWATMLQPAASHAWLESRARSKAPLRAILRRG